MSKDKPQESEEKSEPSLPRHIAIIMDGNGRWAKRNNLPRYAGHREGVKSVRRIVESCKQRGIEALTLFAFSSENWKRPKTEVGLLMDLFLHTLKKEISRLHRNDVRVRFIGDRTAFPIKLQQIMDTSEETTRDNKTLTLIIAANYGGRWDITNATKRLVAQVANGELSVDDINADRLGKELCTAGLPEPDLFIRTGGEERISNFVLWQLAYTELYFTDLLWPAFDDAALQHALDSYSGRQRRFGQTSEQVEHSRSA